MRSSRKGWNEHRSDRSDPSDPSDENLFMRTLIYVPVIHTSADLGSIAEHMAKRAIADLGQEIWEKHRRTVDGFWNVVSDYFEPIDVRGVKIYQDGMVADGQVGGKIVEETAKAGSPNYQLILKLLERGAILAKTEDLDLVKTEYDRLRAIAQATSIPQKLTAWAKYKLAKTASLNRRDDFIAETIQQTLDAGQTGILFLGAFHHIKERLASTNIQIREIKDAAKLRNYQELLAFCRKDQRKFDELGAYLQLSIDDVSPKTQDRSFSHEGTKARRTDSQQ